MADAPPAAAPIKAGVAVFPATCSDSPTITRMKDSMFF